MDPNVGIKRLLLAIVLAGVVLATVTPSVTEAAGSYSLSQQTCVALSRVSDGASVEVCHLITIYKTVLHYKSITVNGKAVKGLANVSTWWETRWLYAESGEHWPDGTPIYILVPEKYLNVDWTDSYVLQ